MATADEQLTKQLNNVQPHEAMSGLDDGSSVI